MCPLSADLRGCVAAVAGEMHRHHRLACRVKINRRNDGDSDRHNHAEMDGGPTIALECACVCVWDVCGISVHGAGVACATLIDCCCVVSRPIFVVTHRHTHGIYGILVKSLRS